MRERIKALVGPRASFMWISTFSFCVRVLRREAAARSPPSPSTIRPTRSMLSLIIKRTTWTPRKFTAKAVGDRISALKNELVSAGAYASAWLAITRTRRPSADFSVYTQRLRAANSLDFDDLIGRTVFLLKKFPEIAKLLPPQFRHTLVDEYCGYQPRPVPQPGELVGAYTKAPADRGPYPDAALPSRPWWVT